MSIPRTNKNPGSLKVNANNIGLTGLVSPIIGQFATFDTTENGFRALTRDILVKETGGLTTVSAIISKYAPEVDNNDTQAYITDVADRLGVLKDQALNLSNNPQRVKAMVEAIANHEDNGILYDPSVITAGIVSEGSFDLSQLQTPTIPIGPEIFVFGSRVDPLPGIANESTGGETVTKVIEDSKNRIITEEIRSNRLNAFAQYTYNITWAVLTTEMYNRVVDLKLNDDPISNLNSVFTSLENSGAIILKSGGSNIKDKSEFFQEDFFINNLNLDSIIGLRMDTRSTNVTNISFEVFEPYGVTLMERIYSLSQSIEDGSKDYLTQPYMLIIDFFGHGDDGKPLKLDKVRKLIPMKLTNITFSVNAGGATYQIEAIPYNESANTIRHGKFDSDQTLMARTVGEALETGSVVTVKEKLIQIDEDGQEIGRGDVAEEITFTIDNDEVRGIAGILNAEQRFKTKKGYQEFADTYNIQIDGDKIREANIIKNQSKELKAKDTRSASGKNQAAKICGIVTNTAKIPMSKKININAGQNIFDAINEIITNSDYISKQYKTDEPLVDAADAGTDFGPGGSNKDGQKRIDKALKFYKITTHVKLKEFDRCRNDYSKDITFFVKPYRVGSANYTFANVKDDIIILKQYDYIFTGQNTQVIQFDIQFNASYFESRTIATKTKVGKEGRENQLKKQDKETNLKADNNKICVDPNTRFPISVFPTIHDPSPGASDPDNPEQHQSRSMFGALMKNARGDLVTLDLQIMGDPDYIFQHSYFGPTPAQPEKAFDDATGSILTDDREIFLRIDFRTPTDLNEAGSTVDFNKSFSTKFRGNKESSVSSMFSGMYKITQVKHVFNGGQFTQTINCFRVYDQVEDKAGIPEQTSSADRPLVDAIDAGTDFGRSTTVKPTNVKSIPEVTVVQPKTNTPTVKVSGSGGSGVGFQLL